MQENGSLTIGNETMPVWKDNVKFSIVLSTWQWCDTVNQCVKGGQSQIGAYIDFAIAVKSKGNASRKAKNKRDHGDADPYSLGFGTMLLSRNVSLLQFNASITQSKFIAAAKFIIRN